MKAIRTGAKILRIAGFPLEKWDQEGGGMLRNFRDETCEILAAEENPIDDSVDVTIPVDPAIAKAPENPERREDAGRVLSGLLKGDHLRDVLRDVIADAKREARAKGLTDEEIDAELHATRAERHS